jgi:hypothetical protein
MYNFRFLQSTLVSSEYATRDAMDYLIRHINQRTDHLQEIDRGEEGLYRYVLDRYNQDHMNRENRSTLLFNSLLGIYNYLFINEREGDERDPTVWVNHAHLGKRRGGSRRKRIDSSRKRRGKRRHSHL